MSEQCAVWTERHPDRIWISRKEPKERYREGGLGTRHRLLFLVGRDGTGPQEAKPDTANGSKNFVDRGSAEAEQKQSKAKQSRAKREIKCKAQVRLWLITSVPRRCPK